MRRLILEFSREEIAKTKGEDPFPSIESLEVTHFLRQDQEELSVICKITLRKPECKIESALSRDKNLKWQILEQQKTGAYLVYMKAIKNNTPDTAFFETGGGYLVEPFEMTSEKIRVTYVGDEGQVRKTHEMLKNIGIHYRIISSTDAKFSPDSPFNALTDKQRAVIIAAYKLGYYSRPRKISSEQLAKKLSIHGSALIAHRRKAELRLLSELLKDC